MRCAGLPNHVLNIVTLYGDEKRIEQLRKEQMQEEGGAGILSPVKGSLRIPNSEDTTFLQSVPIGETLPSFPSKAPPEELSGSGHLMDERKTESVRNAFGRKKKSGCRDANKA